MTENKAPRVRKLHIAFVLTPALLKRLAVVLKEVSEDLQFTVKFADGTSVQYSLDETIEQPNAGNRAIVSLVASTPSEGLPSANVVLKANGEAEEPTIEYTLNGPQQTVIYISDH